MMMKTAALAAAAVVLVGGLFATGEAAQATGEMYGPYNHDSPGITQSYRGYQDLDAVDQIEMEDTGSAWHITAYPELRFARIHEGQFDYLREWGSARSTRLTFRMYADYHHHDGEQVQGRGYVEVDVGRYGTDAWHRSAQDATRENGFESDKDIGGCITVEHTIDSPDVTSRDVTSYSVTIPKDCAGIQTPDMFGAEVDENYCSDYGYTMCIGNWRTSTTLLWSPDLRPAPAPTPIVATPTPVSSPAPTPNPSPNRTVEKTKIKAKGKRGRAVAQVIPAAQREIKLFHRGKVVRAAKTRPGGRVQFRKLTPGKYRVKVSAQTVGSIKYRAAGAKLRVR